MKSYIQVRHPVYRIVSQNDEFISRATPTKVIRAQIGQTCNELDSVQQQKKTKQTKEHMTLYFQGGHQEHEPVMGFRPLQRTTWRTLAARRAETYRRT